VDVGTAGKEFYDFLVGSQNCPTVVLVRALIKSSVCGEAGLQWSLSCSEWSSSESPCLDHKDCLV